MSILLFITILLIALNIRSLVILMPQNPSYCFAKMATALYDMPLETKEDIHGCGLPITMVNGLIIINIVLTFIKLVIGSIRSETTL